MRFKRGMTLGVRGMVLNERNEVFLIKHSYSPGWGLPGGGVEVGQIFYDALVTELKEEGNIDVAREPKLFGVYLNKNTSNRDHVALFIVRDFKQDALPKPNNEIVAHGWFEVTNLPHDTMRGTKERLKEVIECEPVSYYW